MKRKFQLHLDALLALALLFVLALGMNFLQYRIYADLAEENRGLQIRVLEQQFNLDSLQQALQRAQRDAQAESPVAELGRP